MGKKSSFDMLAIKERLDEAKYEAEKARGFKVTAGEKAVHILVALITFTIFTSLTFSYQLAPVLHYSIIILLIIVLAWRVYAILQKK